MPGELATAERWIAAQLDDDTLRGVIVGGQTYMGAYNRHAPEEAPGWYIVYSLQSPGADQTVLCGSRTMSDPLFFIRAVGQDCGFADLEAVEDRLDALFGNASVDAGAVIPGSPAFDVVRESPFQDDDPQEDGIGVTYYITGGLYRFSIRP